MRLGDLRRFCLSLPGAAESVQWGNEHVYKVGGKMFAIISMDQRRFAGLVLKVTDDSFHILTRENGIIPAPYLARAGWVMIERRDILPADQLRAYIVRSHGLVVAKLPKKLRTELAASSGAKARTAP
ncbi:MAG TPA: MmcQ/YjbR family DNA-binding protein [Alphaproteobacteria bacterium]